MKSKSKFRGKAAAVLLAGVLGVACFTTACQPTPAAEAVVNQKEGIPQDALKGESSTPDPQATTAPAAQYSAVERWNETIDKAENFKVLADVDVLEPDVEAYPVEKLATRDLTQELADQLIDHFAPNVEFYQSTQERTKAEWEEMILDMKQALAADQALGDESAVEEDQALIEEWTREYENAPEEAERVPATTEFTYAKDYTGAVMEEEGPIHIQISGERDGSTIQISARKGIPDNPMEFPYFIYSDGAYMTEAQARNNQAALESEKRYAAALEEPYRSEELERLDSLEASLKQELPLYDQNNLDLQEAQQQGRRVLEELGIRGAQIFDCGKALWLPEEESDISLGQPAVYMEFERENGGIPCVALSSSNGTGDGSRTEYSAPFMPEDGALLLDKDWNVRMFCWNNPTEVVEIVAPNSELISLDDAKARLVEELYRNELAVSSEYIEEFGLTYDVEEFKLVMGYVDAQDEPDKALAVPAWLMRAQGRQMKAEENGDSILYNIQEVMISALDGAPILMPGTLQQYNIPEGGS